MGARKLHFHVYAAGAWNNCHDSSHSGRSRDVTETLVLFGKLKKACLHTEFAPVLKEIVVSIVADGS